jgi:hypothetical protein
MARKVKVNMEGVESFTRCPEGEWLARLKKIDMGEVRGSGDDCLKAQFEVIKGDAKGCIVYETFSLTEKALWKLKSFLDAASMKSTGRLTLDLDKMEGKICIIDVIHDDYNGTKRAKIASYIKPGKDADEDAEDNEDIDVDDFDEDEDEDEPLKKSTKPKKTTKKQPEPEVEDLDDDEDGEEEPPAKAKKSTKKTSSKKLTKKAPAKSEPEDDDDDDWEDDDD